mmetsp:Transcript_21199/g.30657  ORF Transcript_21199/g.30657 Transcript_21199/m.30657 type:complete len:910 (-) Transcript_21199:330-3059(-)
MSEVENLRAANKQLTSSLRAAEKKIADLEIKLTVEQLLHSKAEDANAVLTDRLAALEESIACGPRHDESNGSDKDSVWRVRLANMEGQLAAAREMISEKQTEVDIMRQEKESALKEVIALEEAAARARAEEEEEARKRQEDIEREAQLTGVKAKSAFFTRQIEEQQIASGIALTNEQKLKQEAARRRAIKEARRKHNSIDALLMSPDTGKSSRARQVSVGSVGEDEWRNSGAGDGDDCKDGMVKSRASSVEYMEESPRPSEDTIRDVSSRLANSSSTFSVDCSGPKTDSHGMDIEPGLLLSRINTMEANIVNLELQVNDAEHRVSLAESRYEKSQREIQSLKKQVSERDMLIIQLKSGIETLQSDVANRNRDRVKDTHVENETCDAVNSDEAAPPLRARSISQSISDKFSSVFNPASGNYNRESTRHESYALDTSPPLDLGAQPSMTSPAKDPMIPPGGDVFGNWSKNMLIEELVAVKDQLVSKQLALSIVMEEKDAAETEVESLKEKFINSEANWKVVLASVEEELAVVQNKLQAKESAAAILMEERSNLLAELGRPEECSPLKRKNSEDAWQERINDVQRRLAEATNRRSVHGKEVESIIKDLDSTPVESGVSRRHSTGPGMGCGPAGFISESQASPAKTKTESTTVENRTDFSKDAVEDENPMLGPSLMKAWNACDTSSKGSDYSTSDDGSNKPHSDVDGNSPATKSIESDAIPFSTPSSTPFDTPVTSPQVTPGGTKVLSPGESSGGESIYTSTPRRRSVYSATNSRVGLTRRLSLQESQEKLSEIDRRLSTVDKRVRYKPDIASVEAQSLVYEAVVTGYVEERGAILFKVVVRAIGDIEWEVYRRYSAFRELFNRINFETSTLTIESKFPPKKRDSWLKEIDDETVHARQKNVKGLATGSGKII